MWWITYALHCVIEKNYVFIICEIVQVNISNNQEKKSWALIDYICQAKKKYTEMCNF